MESKNETRVTTKTPTKELVEQVQRWVALDAQLKKINEKTKEYREMKSRIGTSIMTYMKTNRLENTKIDISDGQIRLAEKRDYSPLTFTYIETSLHKIIPNQEHVEYIIQYLKDNREVKVSSELKRT